MNVSSIIKGGLVAGLIINLSQTVLNRFIVADQWNGVAAMIGFEQTRSDLVIPYIVGFLIGLAGVWLYAVARPRLGAGPTSALKVGLVVWFLAWFWRNVSLMTLGVLFPMELLLIGTVWTLVETPLAVMAGAWLYSERQDAAA